jgi:diguanylate cyclase (GGDEF)-like protein
MLIFEQLDMARPERLADGIIDAGQALEIEHAKSPVSLYKSVSIGIAVFSADEDLTAEKIIEKADKALYRAKRNGRNQASA